MNFGRGQGPLIIQLFGRGVRLLGRGHSLKRSSEIRGIPHPDRIELLETLQIFGVRASYMSQFRDYLTKEGIDADPRDLFVVPTRLQTDFQNKGLLIIRPQRATTFEQAVQLRFEASETLAPSVDLTARLAAIAPPQAANAAPAVPAAPQGNPLRTIPPHFISMLDWPRLYRDTWRWTHDVKEYTNLALDPAELRKVIENEWYELRCSEEQLSPKSFADLRKIEAIVQQLLQKAITRFYSNAYRQREDEQLSYQTLDVGDENLIDQWEAYVKRSAPQELREALEAMRDHPEWYENDAGFPERVHIDRHLYLPLLVQEDGDPNVKYSPPGLNEGEAHFVRALRDFCQSADAAALLEEWELFLLRNQSRGQGVGFFVGDNRYFPDFILWLHRPDHQHIAFIDPKGLLTGGNLEHNPKVQFHRTVQD
ncbi:MAG: DEAD/DEAH box helicase family protein, partial [Ardenticatenaceae bacterium]